MTHDIPLPEPGLADVRITAASPDVARYVAQVLRAWFAGTEQRSYPAGLTGTGTRLYLTVDTTRPPEEDNDTGHPLQRHVVEGSRQIWP